MADLVSNNAGPWSGHWWVGWRDRIKKSCSPFPLLKMFLLIAVNEKDGKKEQGLILCSSVLCSHLQTHGHFYFFFPSDLESGCLSWIYMPGFLLDSYHEDWGEGVIFVQTAWRSAHTHAKTNSCFSHVHLWSLSHRSSSSPATPWQMALDVNDLYM